MKFTIIKSITGFCAFVFINLLITTNSFSANYETMNVICGGDSVTLSYPGYENLGVVEWQESVDTLNWVSIPEVFGAEYRFFSTQTKYYRGVLKLTDTLYYSPVTLVLMPPVANAGLDKVVGNNTVVLLGNSDGNSQGEWTVFEGDSGIVAEPFNKYSLFGGKYNIDYKLQWKLLNTCGYSVDTVNIRFEEVVAKNNFIVVDMTDSVYSDSTEIANGLLRIKFSDPSIVPSDSVILIGLRDSLSFFQQVISYYNEDSIYYFTTIQAGFDDVFPSGTVNIGDAINQGILEGDIALKNASLGNNNAFPTRETLKQYSGNKNTFLLYKNFSDEELTLKSANQETGEKTLRFTIPSSEIFEAYNGMLKITLEDFVFELTPNFCLKYSFFPFNFSYGLDNSILKCTYGCTFEALGNYDFKSVDKIIWRPMNQKKLFVVQAGPVPIVIVMNSFIKASSSFGVDGAITITQKGTYTNYLTATIEAHTVGQPHFNLRTKEISSSTIDVADAINFGLHAELVIGPEVSFKIWDVVGPYIQTPVKIEASFNGNTDFNWSGEVSAGLYGFIGAKAEIEKTRLFKGYTLFDYKYSLWGDALSVKYKLPNKLELLSGDNQTGTSGLLLAKPLVFKVKDSFGNGVPLVPVRFELENGSGTIQKSVILSDIFGQVKVFWTLGANSINRIKAYVLDYSNNDIQNSPINATAYATDNSDPCKNSNLAISIKTSGNYKYPVVTGGIAPFVYSTNGTDYSSNIPQFDNSVTGNFRVYVKDKNQCSVTRSFSTGNSLPCGSSNLSMDINVLSKTINVTGKNGTPPYLFSIDNQENFSTNSIFSNLTTGSHTVYVKDSKQCISTGNVDIDAQTIPAIKASNPADGASYIPVTNLTFKWLAGSYTPNQVYDLYLKKGNEDYSLIASNLTTTMYSLTDFLANGTIYKWKISVKGIDGNLFDFKEFTFSTVSDKSTTPVSPVLVYPANDDVTGIYLTFQWLAQEGDFKYDVYLDELNATKLVGSNLTNPQLTINKLRSGVTYFWKVKVKSTVTGESAFSPVWSFTTNSSLGAAFEYWFNDNYEERVYLKVPSQLLLILNKAISTDELLTGLNTIHFRFKDSKGYWSSVVSEVFHKFPMRDEEQLKLISYEYWYDNDYEQRLVENIAPSETYSLNLINTTGVETGLHTLHIRYKDSGGQWSSVVSEVFHKFPERDEEQLKLTSYEYWFDNQYEQRLVENITPAQTFSLNQINTTGVETGLHTLHIRYKDSGGQWSSVVSEVFHKFPVRDEEQLKLTSYEYWFDNQYEQRLVENITPSETFSLNQINTTGVETGLHTLHIRYKDSGGQWSSVVSEFFHKVNESNDSINLIKGVRYCFNQDSENMSYIQIDAETNPLEYAGSLNVQNLNAGLNTIQLQFLDSRGYWSSVVSDTFLVDNQILFNLNLDAGWNILSVPLNPVTLDIVDFSLKLIENNSLVKIQDESGSSLENWGIFGGWKNNIGELALTEGYKVKVNRNDSLIIFGTAVDYPFAIPLAQGWNIIGYPHLESYDALEVIQQLIDRGTLIKVQDERGNSIEDWGIYGSWKNNIGNFNPGKGYNLKVKTKDTLWIYQSYPKSVNVTPIPNATTHFIWGFEGNGIDHMNINIVELPQNILRAGDELAVFDGEKCVGAIALMPWHLQNRMVFIPVSAADNMGLAGFNEGNRFVLKLWSTAAKQEYVLEPEIYIGSSKFERNETAMISLKNLVLTGLDGFRDIDLTEINCYPNPFKDEITIEISLPENTKVQIDVLNQLGQLVKTVAAGGILNQGVHRITWYGTNTGKGKVTTGIYYIRLKMGERVYFRKVIYSK